MKYSRYKKRTNRISTCRTDWKYLGHFYSEKEKIFDSPEFIEMSEEEKYRTIINKIREATFEASGLKYKIENGRVVREFNNKTGFYNFKTGQDRRKCKKNPVEWWDIECESVVKEREKALSKYNKDKSMPNKIEYKKQSAVARRLIKSKKTENFKAFVTSLNRFK